MLFRSNGIGRPSTYASIIGVLQDREYAHKIEGRFKPSALGMMITELLTKSFDDIIDVEYTRSLEDDLDKIEQTLRNEFMSNLARTSKRDSHEMMANIFNSFDRQTETRFITSRCLSRYSFTHRFFCAMPT